MVASLKIVVRVIGLGMLEGRTIVIGGTTSFGMVLAKSWSADDYNLGPFVVVPATPLPRTWRVSLHL